MELYAPGHACKRYGFRQLRRELLGASVEQSGETAASQKLTEQVYDMLFENRLSPYNLPYDVLDERAAVRYFVTNFSFFSVLTDNAPFHTALYNV